ncbi:MAG: hypothetical protein KC589_04865 [Nanoarchaeota archaeon]|nr:hypothetical protein [Nanoarchaeota archaeon]
MGKVTNLKTVSGDKVTITLELSEKEALWLKGNLDKMHLFSENNLEYTTRLVQRGTRDSTKYFLLPKDFRKGILLSNAIKCNRIETKTKYIFLFAVNKY